MPYLMLQFFIMGFDIVLEHNLIIPSENINISLKTYWQKTFKVLQKDQNYIPRELKDMDFKWKNSEHVHWNVVPWEILEQLL